LNPSKPLAELLAQIGTEKSGGADTRQKKKKRWFAN